MSDQEEDREEGDKPIVDLNTFQRPVTSNPRSHADKARYSGLRINYIPLELTDDDILKFLNKEVTTDITKESVDIIRHKKTTSASIPSGINLDIVSDALGKINFLTSRVMFMNVPLYCRPLKDITPEKPAPPTTPSSSKDFGTEPRIPLPKIPGLPFQVQAKAIERQQKKDKDKKSAEKVKGKKTGESDPEMKTVPNAFEFLM